jgi:hypothetical protein
MNIKDYIMRYLKATKYNIGFVEGDLQSVLDGAAVKVNWLKHPYKDRWFADPFILEVTNSEIIVLVEEWYDPIQRGRISKLTIDKDTFELKSLKVMIDDGSHMSFPAIERRNKDVYIHPENCVTGKLKTYRYNESKDCFEKEEVLCEEPLTDSVITDMFGQKYMFSTKIPDANGKELGIYSWDSTRCRYSLHDTYFFKENIARMAGNFFKYKDKVYRPGQVCIKSYGDAVSLQQVTCENGVWSFKELRRIYSPHPDLDLGFHTFNVYKDIIVVDAVGYRRARLCHFLRTMKHLIR